MTTDEVTRGTAAAIAEALGMSLSELKAAVSQPRRGRVTEPAPVIRKTPHAGAAAQSEARHWPAEARAFVREAEAHAIRAGADEQELHFIRTTLLRPENAVIYEGDRPRELTETELMIELRALAGALLEAWLPERIKRRKEGTA